MEWGQMSVELVKCLSNLGIESKTTGGSIYYVIDGLASITLSENERSFLVNQLGDILSELCNKVFSEIRFYDGHDVPENMHIADLFSTWAADKVEVKSDLPKDFVPASQIISSENGYKFVSAQCHPDILKIFYNFVFNSFNGECKNVIRQVCVETTQSSEMSSVLKTSKEHLKNWWQYFFAQERTVNLDLTEEDLDAIAKHVRSSLGKMILVYRELRI